MQSITLPYPRVNEENVGIHLEAVSLAAHELHEARYFNSLEMYMSLDKRGKFYMEKECRREVPSSLERPIRSLM